MKSVPFYIGVLLIIPVVTQTDKNKVLINGYGVGALLSSDQAILHEGIKDDIGQHALLVWVDEQEKQGGQAPPPIQNIIENLRYVSIENTWYKTIQEASKTSLLRKSIAGTGAMDKHMGVSWINDALRLGMHPGQDTAPVAGTELPGFAIRAKEKVVVTVFAGSPGLYRELKSAQSGQQEWALVVERFQSL